MTDAPVTFGLYGGPFSERAPHSSERDFFFANPSVGGMASEDNRVVMNPFSGLSQREKNAVRNNEMARLLMRVNPSYRPDFSLTPEQSSTLQGLPHYANAPQDAQRETIAARIYSGDPSGGLPTEEQSRFVEALRTYFGVRASPFSVGGR